MAHNMRGADFSYWTGDSATYDAVHWRLLSYRGRASEQTCVECGKPAQHWAYDHSGTKERQSPTGMPYSTDLSTYRPMCASCHKTLDSARAGKARCGTKSGFQKHLRLGQKPCDACREARNTYHRLRRQALRLAELEEI